MSGREEHGTRGHGSATAALRAAAVSGAPISLDEVLAQAALQTRVDRKYLVTPGDFAALIDVVGARTRVLEIDGRRDLRYESVYFDTPDLAAYRGAASGRRRKFKVRTRTYLDSGDCMLEVKTAGGRDQTVKERVDHDPERPDRLDHRATDFVTSRIGDVADELAPVLITAYTRVTFVDVGHDFRMTCDADLRLLGPDGAGASLLDRVLVETKSAGPPCVADRVLWRLGCRPDRISKYCVGMALLDPTLPANRWNRTLREHFDWEPQRAA